MVRHCINPACRAEFTLFHSGYLYAHERQFADTRFVWLCSPCGSQFVPYLDSDGGVSVMPRSGRYSPPPPRADGYLRLVAAPRRNPWSSAVPAGVRRADPPAMQWKPGASSAGEARSETGNEPDYEPGYEPDKDKASAA